MMMAIVSKTSYLIPIVFVPVAIKPGGTWHHQAWNWYRRLEDRRPILQAMPGSPPALSMALQGDAVLLFQNTFTAN